MIRAKLKLYAIDILNNPSFEDKISSGLAIGEYAALIQNETYDQTLFKGLSEKFKLNEARIQAGLPDSIPNYEAYIPTVPRRDTDWTYDPDKESKMTATDDLEKRIFSILDATYVDVEINAMEVSAVLFLSGSTLPLDFFKDFGSHISDEARHANSIRALWSLFPHFDPTKTYSNRVWSKVSKGKNLLERVMIENVIEEGWAADKTVGLIQYLEDNNFLQIANVFRQINSDEIRHASIGNKWAMKLLDENEEKYFTLFDELSTKFNPGAKRIESIPTRLSSGFSKNFIKKYF